MKTFGIGKADGSFSFSLYSGECKHASLSFKSPRPFANEYFSYWYRRCDTANALECAYGEKTHKFGITHWVTYHIIISHIIEKKGSTFDCMREHTTKSIANEVRVCDWQKQKQWGRCVTLNATFQASVSIDRFDQLILLLLFRSLLITHYHYFSHSFFFFTIPARECGRTFCVWVVFSHRVSLLLLLFLSLGCGDNTSLKHPSLRHKPFLHMLSDLDSMLDTWK